MGKMAFPRGPYLVNDATIFSPQSSPVPEEDVELTNGGKPAECQELRGFGYNWCRIHPSRNGFPTPASSSTATCRYAEEMLTLT